MKIVFKSIEFLRDETYGGHIFSVHIRYGAERNGWKKEGGFSVTQKYSFGAEPNRTDVAEALENLAKQIREWDPEA